MSFIIQKKHKEKSQAGSKVRLATYRLSSMVPCKVGQDPPSASVIKNKFGAGVCLFYCFAQQLEVPAKQKMMSHSEGT